MFDDKDASVTIRESKNSFDKIKRDNCFSPAVQNKIKKDGLMNKKPYFNCKFYFLILFPLLFLFFLSYIYFFILSPSCCDFKRNYLFLNVS